MKAALASGVDVEGVNIDLRLSKIKPVLAKWLMHANEHLADRELIASAFEKAWIQQFNCIITMTPLKPIGIYMYHMNDDWFWWLK